ncbi:MarR family transcriptional regulator [Cohnella silvisoli]|uniref:MarR family transcriptional regulator n=1 Tax=Cohnella silvisoli TaxID=2873699 RepID=A0ABV1KY66_9BACL|nr:MarR family transcriptional regulator [Cohnella silvisoli]MCD9024126.1 MarR family transcriptional regulator [Cohnella silvisoli]
MINRRELLVSYSKKFSVHRRMWETEWNRRNTTDLSYPQFLILNILDQEGPKQSKELVNFFSITSGGITAIANKLISQGLIVRTRDDHLDRRAVLMEISDKGREILKSLESVRDQSFETIFACLTDAEIAYLEQIYGKLIGDRPVR